MLVPAAEQHQIGDDRRIFLLQDAGLFSTARLPSLTRGSGIMRLAFVL